MGGKCKSQNCWQLQACWTCLAKKGWCACKRITKIVTNPRFLIPKQKNPTACFLIFMFMHQIRIIQHPWDLICCKLWGTHLCLRWYDRSKISLMYFRLKIVLNWGHILNWGQRTFRHYYICKYKPTINFRFLQGKHHFDKIINVKNVIIFVKYQQNSLCFTIIVFNKNMIFIANVFGSIT